MLFSCLVVWTLCDATDCSTPGFPVLHYLLEFAQTPHNLLPHVTSVHLSAANSSPWVEIVPQSLHSSSQLLPFPGDQHFFCGMYDCGKDCLILIPFRLPQISCFTLSLKCFSSDSDNFPDVGIGHLLQFPHQPRTGLVLLTLLFFPLVPSSYQVLHGSIYSFPVVR